MKDYLIIVIAVVALTAISFGMGVSFGFKQGAADELECLTKLNASLKHELSCWKQLKETKEFHRCKDCETLGAE